MRIFKTILIVLGIYVAALVVDVFVASGTSNYQYLTILFLLGNFVPALVIDFILWSGTSDHRGEVTLLALLGILAFSAPKVGYRWFDAFFTMIPFYGIFFIFRVAHRIAFLPERDWSKRVD